MPRPEDWPSAMDRTSARLLAPALILLPAIALAQGGPSAFQFSFSNPGARSLGLAGAFAALADDATAAFANPAGLVQLTRPEVSFEGRSWSYSTPFTEGGRVSGEPTGILLDTVDGLRTSRSEADLSGLSFLSYVYPKGNWSFAAYRHVLAKFEALRETQGFFVDSVEFPRFADFRSVLDIQIVSYSVAGAYRAKEGLSFGVGLSYFEADLLFVNETYAPRVATLPEGPFGRNVFDPSAIVESADRLARYSVGAQRHGILGIFGELDALRPHPVHVRIQDGSSLPAHAWWAGGRARLQRGCVPGSAALVGDAGAEDFVAGPEGPVRGCGSGRFRRRGQDVGG